jgi:hypothetical protein
MTFYAIIGGRNHADNSIRSILFKEAIHIGSRESRLEMLAEWVVDRSTVVLRSMIQGTLDALRINPSKIGLQGFNVW